MERNPMIHPFLSRNNIWSISMTATGRGPPPGLIPRILSDSNIGIDDNKHTLTRYTGTTLKYYKILTIIWNQQNPFWICKNLHSRQITVESLSSVKKTFRFLFEKRKLFCQKSFYQQKHFISPSPILMTRMDGKWVSLEAQSLSF